MFNIHRYICYTCMEVSKWVVDLIHPKFKLETVLKFNSLLSALRWHCHISVNKKRPKATALKKKRLGASRAIPKSAKLHHGAFGSHVLQRRLFVPFFMQASLRVWRKVCLDFWHGLSTESYELFKHSKHSNMQQIPC